jgi:hypothetical protein
MPDALLRATALDQMIGEHLAPKQETLQEVATKTGLGRLLRESLCQTLRSQPILGA